MKINKNSKKKVKKKKKMNVNNIEMILKLTENAKKEMMKMKKINKMICLEEIKIITKLWTINLEEVLIVEWEEE